MVGEVDDEVGVVFVVGEVDYLVGLIRVFGGIDSVSLRMGRQTSMHLR